MNSSPLRFCLRKVSAGVSMPPALLLSRRTSQALQLVALTGTLAACAPRALSPADALLRQGDYSAAVVAYEAERTRNPQDSIIARNIGAALLQLGRLDEARASLRRSVAIDPADAEAFLLLGRTEARSGRAEESLQAYSDYLAAGGKKNSRVVREMEEQRREITRHRLRVARAFEAATADSLNANLPQQGTVAVSPFANLGENERLESLSRGLAAILTTDLSQVEEFRVLERIQFQTLLDELALQESDRVAPDLATDSDSGSDPDSGPGSDSGSDPDPGSGSDSDPDTATVRSMTSVPSERASEAGWVLGARHLIQGAFLGVGNQSIELSADIMQTLDGVSSVAGDPVQGRLANVMRLEKTLVYQILRHFGIEPTEEERERIDRLATGSLAALLAYGRGLRLEDEGDLPGAIAAYQEAATIDEAFQEPLERLEVVEAGGEDPENIDKAQIEVLTEPAESPDVLDDLVIRVSESPDPDDGDTVDAGEPGGTDPVATPDVRGPEVPSSGGEPGLPGFPDTPWGGRP